MTVYEACDADRAEMGILLSDTEMQCKKQTNKQANERVEVIMYGLSPYDLFDNLTS